MATTIIIDTLPLIRKFINGTCRAKGGIARVTHKGRSDEPRLAPSIKDKPTINGRASMETIVTIINTDATEECIMNVRTAPTRNAVIKSRAREVDIYGRNELSCIGITVARINSKATKIRATPNNARPICFSVGDLPFRNINPPNTNSTGLSQPISRLKN